MKKHTAIILVLQLILLSMGTIVQAEDNDEFAYLKPVYTLEEQKDYGAALNKCKELLSQPQPPEQKNHIKAETALLYHLTDQPNLAYQLTEQALKESEDGIQIPLFLLDYFIAGPDPDPVQAKKYLDMIEKNSSDPVQLCMAQVEYYEGTKDTAKVDQLLNALTEKNCKNPDVLFMIGRYYQLRKNYDKAIKLLEAARAMGNPEKKIEATSALLYIYEKVGEKSKIMAYCDELLASDLNANDRLNYESARKRALK
jgi:tetratricopeptide (TPR) repeat protein